MSRTTKKKYVTSQLVHQTVERLEDGQFIAKIISSRGNNLHEVLTADEDSFLVYGFIFKVYNKGNFQKHANQIP